jgi:hypothetical protein
MYSAVVLLPLIGAIAAFLFLIFAKDAGFRDRAAQLVTSGCLVLSALLAIVPSRRRGPSSSTRCRR